MSLRALLVRFTFVALAGSGLACGSGSSTIGGNGNGNGQDAGLPPTSTQDAGPKTCDEDWVELCNGLDDDCDGKVDEDFDADQDLYSQCGAQADCNDGDETVHPNATELANGVDDNCDGKIDLGANGVDYDQDGTAYPDDCNDDEPLVGKNAVEVAGDGTDNNCNNQIDEVVDCEAGIGGEAANDFLRAMGLCGPFVVGASFSSGNAGARAIRTQFGNHYTAPAGARMIQLSSGKAVDNLEDSGYVPQDGTNYLGSSTHPLWRAPKCGPGGSSAPSARDLTELRIDLKVPQNAKSFSYQVNFFSAEYPEYVCTKYNDRFIALLKSSALDPAQLPGGKAANCTNSTTPECNVSFDVNGQPLTINNGFFSVCRSFSGTGTLGQAVNNTCAANTEPFLAKTGYDKGDTNFGLVGGGTGWLSTKAPVTPGEDITLRFIILDEGDNLYDSTVLIDGFQWELQEVTAPETSPIG